MKTKHFSPFAQTMIGLKKTRILLLVLLMGFFCKAGLALPLDSSFSREKNYSLEGL
ncbi:MAG TPA: hypothetical protein V6C82_00795 [Chroococcales cyanobacterium]|jgi:hypothetical protein